VPQFIDYNIIKNYFNDMIGMCSATPMGPMEMAQNNNNNLVVMQNGVTPKKWIEPNEEENKSPQDPSLTPQRAERPRPTPIAAQQKKKYGK